MAIIGQAKTEPSSAAGSVPHNFIDPKTSRTKREIVSNFLKIISDKKHKEYKETLEWVGGYYDPEEFEIDIINGELSELDEYIKEWEEDMR